MSDKLRHSMDVGSQMSVPKLDAVATNLFKELERMSKDLCKEFDNSESSEKISIFKSVKDFFNDVTKHPAYFVETIKNASPAELKAFNNFMDLRDESKKLRNAGRRGR